LFAGTLKFLGSRISHAWYVAAGVVVAWTVTGLLVDATSLVVRMPGFVFLGLASIVTGLAWLRATAGVWARLSGWVFIVWGVHRLNYPLLRDVDWFAPVGYGVGAFLALLAAFSVLVAHFEKIRASLSASERRYRELFHRSASVMLLIDPRDGSIVDANEAAEHYYGWSHDALTAMRIIDINTLTPEEVKTEMAKAAAERSHFLFSHRLADGSVREVEVYTGPADVDGRKLLYSIIHDISDRRRVERELAEHKDRLEALVEERTGELLATNRRLEAAQKAKDGFLANMSHELRTPLNSIIGFSGLLAEGLAGDLTAEQRRQIAMVRSSGRHLLALVNDLLDVSAIDSGRTKPSLAVVDLCDVVKELATNVEPRCAEQDLEFRVEGCGEHQSCLLVTDRQLIEQIVWNLLDNAVKFTDHGCITLAVRPAPGGAEISVTDTGAGIGFADLDRVFEDFVQLEAVQGAKNPGTGLGLAISRRLSEILGGRLDAASELGHGSTFMLAVMDHGRTHAAPALAWPIGG